MAASSTTPARSGTVRRRLKRKTAEAINRSESNSSRAVKFPLAGGIVLGICGRRDGAVVVTVTLTLWEFVPSSETELGETVQVALAGGRAVNNRRPPAPWLNRERTAGAIQNAEIVQWSRLRSL
jgi:hypothetical protein